MNRQFRRRVKREWNKIKADDICTKFVERNNLFPIPHALYFRAIKLCEDVMCVYSVGIFQFREGSGFLENATVCQFTGSFFRTLCSVPLDFVFEEELEKDEDL